MRWVPPPCTCARRCRAAKALFTSRATQTKTRNTGASHERIYTGWVLTRTHRTPSFFAPWLFSRRVVGLERGLSLAHLHISSLYLFAFVTLAVYWTKAGLDSMFRLIHEPNYLGLSTLVREVLSNTIMNRGSAYCSASTSAVMFGFYIKLILP